MSDTGIIYIATSKTSGKSYIGQTETTLNNRKQEHSRKSKTATFKFYYAIRKYGFDDFEWGVLYTVQSDKLNVAEMCAVYLYDTYTNGYNSTTGGDHYKLSQESRDKIIKANIGRKLSEESRQKISNSLTGRKMSPEAKKKMFDSRQGENHPRYGKKHTEESKKKMSEAHAGKIISEETRKRLSVALTGRIITAEARAKLSKANTGRIFSDSHKEKISTAKLGKKASVQTREKMSKYRKGRSLPRHKITDEQVNEIVEICSTQTINKKDLAVRYGISHSYVFKLLKQAKCKNK